MVISALIIGALLTSLPLSEYFSHPTFSRCFLNVLGEIQYYLPGVCENNPSDVVNVQLWTIPYELKCYIGIWLISLVSLHRRPRLFLGLLVVATIVLTFLSYFYWEMRYGRPSGRSVFWAFLWGVAIYLLREKIPHSFYLFCGALAATWLFLQRPETEFLAENVDRSIGAGYASLRAAVIGLNCNRRKHLGEKKPRAAGFFHIRA